MVQSYELHDDILTEIFLRTPVKSLFRFKCVSSKWNRLFSSLSFRSKYLSLHRVIINKELIPTIGFFQASFHIHIKTPSYFLASEPRLVNVKVHNYIIFLGTSNGMILCGCLRTDRYMVCDPATGRTLMIPRGTGRIKDKKAVGFYYEDITESASANFKIVVPGTRYSEYMTFSIETYSSDERVWKESRVFGCYFFHLDDDYPSVVIHGLFYWIASKRFLVVYDPNDASNWVWLFWLPPTRGIKDYVLGGTKHNKSLFLAVDDYPGFRIFKLAKNVHSYTRYYMKSDSEWTSLYFISYPPRPTLPENSLEFAHIYPRLIGFHPQDVQYLLMRIGRHVFWLHLASMKKYTIQYSGEIASDLEFRLLPLYFSTWPPTFP